MINRFATGAGRTNATMDLEREGNGHFIPLFISLNFGSEFASKINGETIASFEWHLKAGDEVAKTCEDNCCELAMTF